MVGFKGEGKMKDSSTNTNTNNEEERKMENRLKEAREAGRMEILEGLVSSLNLLNWDQLDPIKELREFIKYEASPRGYKDKQTWEETKDIIHDRMIRELYQQQKKGGE